MRTEVGRLIVLEVEVGFRRGAERKSLRIGDITAPFCLSVGFFFCRSRSGIQWTLGLHPNRAIAIPFSIGSCN